jgi:putative transposase
MAIAAIDIKLIDNLLVGYKKPEDIIGKNGLLKQLTKALLELAMHAELTEHVGYGAGSRAPITTLRSQSPKNGYLNKPDVTRLAPPRA